MNLGENVRKYRERRNLTQQEVAEQAGIRQAYLSQVERGTKTLTVPTALAIARVLDVTLSELVG